MRRPSTYGAGLGVGSASRSQAYRLGGRRPPVDARTRRTAMGAVAGNEKDRQALSASAAQDKCASRPRMWSSSCSPLRSGAGRGHPTCSCPVDSRPRVRFQYGRTALDSLRQAEVPGAWGTSSRPGAQAESAHLPLPWAVRQEIRVPNQPDRPPDRSTRRYRR